MISVELIVIFFEYVNIEEITEAIGSNEVTNNTEIITEENNIDDDVESMTEENNTNDDVETVTTEKNMIPSHK